MPAQFDVFKIKDQFPLLAADKKLIYLDNAATTQKPAVVLDAMDKFYRTDYANVHRGVYEMSVRATERYEESRASVARFINARANEIVFTKNATEAINLIAYSFGAANIKEGDEILVSILEHHSNFVPWQRLCKERGARLVAAPSTAGGKLDEEAALALISDRTRLVALTAMSNVTGVTTPLERIIARAKERGARVLIDGAQLVAHAPCDVRALGADFFVFSGHKMFGPTGIGVLWAREMLLQTMEPFMAGGEMVLRVSISGAEWNDAPWKFEAGTPPIAEAIGLARACEYITSIGWNNICAHERKLTEHLYEQLRAARGVAVFALYAGKTTNTHSRDLYTRAPIAGFEVEGIHGHDLASILNEQHIAVRSGYFCAEPFLRSLRHSALARASLTLYNTSEDIGALIAGIKTAQKIFRV